MHIQQSTPKCAHSIPLIFHSKDKLKKQLRLNHQLSFPSLFSLLSSSPLVLEDQIRANKETLQSVSSTYIHSFIYE
ncbi:hypothetical protein L6452_40110 [Arctium lappa]|uniref:Uncharacterized protein n=1 Tax=Arctium lappa TaxID=4217 RepID=A0ACB8XLC2_ARCLA|nr:hypothetical protein L6452_40110 [Arctium lappa]